jgi:hypothetical protein
VPDHGADAPASTPSPTNNTYEQNAHAFGRTEQQIGANCVSRRYHFLERTDLYRKRDLVSAVDTSAMRRKMLLCICRVRRRADN